MGRFHVQRETYFFLAHAYNLYIEPSFHHIFLFFFSVQASCNTHLFKRLFIHCWRLGSLEFCCCSVPTEFPLKVVQNVHASMDLCGVCFPVPLLFFFHLTRTWCLYRNIYLPDKAQRSSVLKGVNKFYQNIHFSWLPGLTILGSLLGTALDFCVDSFIGHCPFSGADALDCVWLANEISAEKYAASWKRKVEAVWQIYQNG